MSEALEHGVNMTRVAFGVVPYGTGNDFSRVFGWGSTNPVDIFDREMAGFKKLVRNWLAAEISDFDLWEVSVSVAQNGHIRRWSNSSSTIVRSRGRRGRPIRTFTKLMSNYFSVGIESRIGMGFDQHRTHSQVLNKGVYAVEGAKNILRPIHRIKDTVQECSSGDNMVFTTDGSLRGAPLLKGNPVSLIFLNINSFASGCDLWSGATASGLDQFEPVEFDTHSPGDGKLEVMTYQSLVALGFEQVRKIMRWAPSFGQRVAQVKGAIRLSFRPNATEPIYAQIDGEFYQLDNPKEVTIRHKVKARVLEHSSTDFL